MRRPSLIISSHASEAASSYGCCLGSSVFVGKAKSAVTVAKECVEAQIMAHSWAVRALTPG